MSEGSMVERVRLVLNRRMADGRPFTQGELRGLAFAECQDQGTAYRAAVKAIERAKGRGEIELSGFGVSAVWRLAALQEASVPLGGKMGSAPEEPRLGLGS